MIRYIIIEKIDPNMPTIVSDADGYPLMFVALEDVKKESEKCGDPQIVPLTLIK